MAYISTEHSVGDIVYAYDSGSDSVQRLRIVGMHASTADAGRWGGGEWSVSYVAEPAQAKEASLAGTYQGSRLHSTAREAFPAIPPQVAPATEQAEAA